MVRKGSRAVAGVVSAIASIVLVLALAGCGSSDDGPASTSGDPAGHNAADVTFANQMIPHHAQALAMVDLSMGRELSPELQQLTDAIRDAQAPEIELMADWLQSWGEEVPETMRDHANAHGDGELDEAMAEMPGMMSSERLSDLGDARDVDFEQLWLTMMVEHHEGAIEMATTELADGQHAETLALAQSIIDGQTAEIETMKALLG